MTLEQEARYLAGIAVDRYEISTSEAECPLTLFRRLINALEVESIECMGRAEFRAFNNSDPVPF